MHLKNPFSSTPALWKKTGVALFALAALLPARADPPGEADHEELRAMLVTVTKAINEENFDLLEPILAEPFCFTTSDQVTATSLAGIKEHYDQVFKSGDYPVTGLSVQPEAAILTQFTTDTTGYCYGTAAETYTLKAGDPIKLASTWTATVVKVDGGWKLSTAHVGVHFMENPIIDKLGATVKWALIGGLIAGVAGGFLLARLIGGRRARRSR